MTYKLTNNHDHDDHDHDVVVANENVVLLRDLIRVRVRVRVHGSSVVPSHDPNRRVQQIACHSKRAGPNFEGVRSVLISLGPVFIRLHMVLASVYGPCQQSCM